MHQTRREPVARHARRVLSAVKHRLMGRIRGDWSQHGESRRLRSFLGKDDPRILVEVGANDGVTCSTSYAFVRDGWTAVLIEPSARTFERLRRNVATFRAARVVRAACGAEAGEAKLFLGRNDLHDMCATLCRDENDWFAKVRSDDYETVPVRTLTEVMDSEGLPREIGMLLVDAEGLDLEVLEGVDFGRYRPRIIITEDYAPTREEKFWLLQRHGYRHVDQCAVNSIWRDDTAGTA